MMEPYENKMKKMEKKLILLMKKCDQKLERADFEMMIIKKVDRDDVNEMLENMKGGSDDVQRMRNETIQINKKIR